MPTFMPSFRAETTRRNNQNATAIVVKIDKIPLPRRKKIIARLDRMLREYIVDLGDIKVGATITYDRPFWQRRFGNVVRFLKAQLVFIAS